MSFSALERLKNLESTVLTLAKNQAKISKFGKENAETINELLKNMISLTEQVHECQSKINELESRLNVINISEGIADDEDEDYEFDDDDDEDEDEEDEDKMRIKYPWDKVQKGTPISIDDPCEFEFRRNSNCDIKITEFGHRKVNCLIDLLCVLFADEFCIEFCTLGKVEYTLVLTEKYDLDDLNFFDYLDLVEDMIERYILSNEKTIFNFKAKINNDWRLICSYYFDDYDVYDVEPDTDKEDEDEEDEEDEDKWNRNENHITG